MRRSFFHFFCFFVANAAGIIFCISVVTAQLRAQQAETYQRILIVPSQQEMLILDRYHRAFDEDDMVANAVYALRNTKIMELLQTRKELKYFIGGTERARRLAIDKNFTFAFRQRTCELYIENCYQDSMNIDAESLGYTGMTAFVRSPLYELHKAIFDLYTTEETYDEDIRIKLVFGLVHISAVLSKIDRYLHWFKKEVWQYKKILPLGECADSGDSTYLDYRDIGRKNCKAKLRMEGARIVEALSWYRTFLIDRYRILIARVRYDSRGDHLYKLIYRQLERIGFPALKQKLKPAPNYRGLSWPASFEDKLHEALRELPQNKNFRKVFPTINNYIDMALLQALQANSKMLHKLGEEIHFDPHKSKNLLMLTRDEGLWKRTSEHFGYLSAVIDFQRVREDFAAQAATQQQRRARTHRFAEYSAIGLGGLGLLASINLPPLLQKKPLFAALAWLVGGSLLTWNELNDLLYNQVTKDNVLHSYFGNAKDQHTFDEISVALRTHERDKLSFVFSALLLSADLFFLNKLTGVFSKAYARLSPDNNSFVAALRARSERLTYRLRRKVSSKFRTFKAVLTGEYVEYYSKNPHIDRALRFLSREWRTPRWVLDKTLFRLVSKEKLAAAIRKRTRHDDFITYLFSSTFVSLTHLTLTEWRLYGDDLKYNLDRIAVDYISTIFFSCMLSWINFGETQTVFGGLFRKARSDQLHMTLKERAGIFKTQFLRTLGVGFVGTFPAVSLVELNRLRRGEKTSREALRNIMGMSIFGAAYISTISNLRVQFLREVSRAIEGHKGMMIVLHNVNSLFGQWFWVKTKDASSAYKNIEVHGRRGYYLVKGVKAEHGRSYLFDFMGDNAHPAKTLQLPRQLDQHYR